MATFGAAVAVGTPVAEGIGVGVVGAEGFVGAAAARVINSVGEGWPGARLAVAVTTITFWFGKLQASTALLSASTMNNRYRIRLMGAIITGCPGTKKALTPDQVWLAPES